ncbi:MAG: YdeI/OmpD-associated family protein [Anaerolineaceae bacterium]
MKQVFRTNIKGDAAGPTGIEVPAAVISALGPKKNPPVILSLSGYSYRSTVAVMDDAFMVPLSKAHREAAGVKAGEIVEVEIELDVEPRSVEVPEDLAEALAGTPGAREAFDRLAPSMRKEFVRQVTEAKAPETRRRRIEGVAAKMAAVKENRKE